MLKTFTWTFGVIFTAIGVLGFVPALAADNMLLGIFEIDTLHNIIHLATGLMALYIAWGAMGYAQMYFKVFGVVYAIVAVVGLLQGDSVLGLIAVNMADNALHLIVAAAALWAGFGMKNESMVMGM